jgi:hypothetical protein
MKVLNGRVRRVLSGLLVLTLLLAIAVGPPLTTAKGQSEVILEPNDYRWAEGFTPDPSSIDDDFVTLYWEVHFVNLGEDEVYNVRATIISVPEYVAIVDGEVSFDDPIPAGLGDWSDDDFCLTIDTTVDPDTVDMWEGIEWQVEYDVMPKVMSCWNWIFR